MPQAAPIAQTALSARIDRLVAKLAEVRARFAGGAETFGSPKHHFVLGAPLTEDEVCAFECAHGVALPADFRAFVTLAGGSGAGPFYGLLPLSSWGDARQGDEPDPGWLARPCLFSPAEPGVPPRPGAYEAAIGDAAEPFQGAIAIVDQGCTYYALLVVSGAHAGRVLYVNLDGGVPFFVESPDFLSWYERWLDELLWGHRHFWFGLDMPGDEAHLAAVAGDPSSPRRGEALSAMYRLPGLAEGTAAVVVARAGDADPAVRAAALAVIGRQHLAAAEPAVRAALASDVGAVRLAAHRALKAIGAPWQEAARAALDDPEPKLVSYALGELVAVKALDVDRLLRLLESPEAEIARAALVALQSSTSSAALAVLLGRARAERGERGAYDVQTYQALLAQVRAGVATAEQEQEALDLVLDRLARATTGPSRFVDAIGAFVPRHPRALAALTEATRHADGFVRFEAARVLGEGLSADAADAADAADVRQGPEFGVALEALEALRSDATMPREPQRSTAWSVGENANRALARIRAARGGAG